MQWWQFRFTPMRSVILAKVSVLKIAWGAWRFARGDGNAIACRQRARLQDLVRYARSASPYYRLRYRHLPPGGVDLQSLPPVTKRRSDGALRRMGDGPRHHPCDRGRSWLRFRLVTLRRRPIAVGAKVSRWPGPLSC